MFILDRAYEALGLQHVTVQVPEMYEALSRGVVDCIGLPPGPMMVLNMYEVAESYVSVGTYTAAIPIIVNLDMWNGLTPEMQGWFMEAAQASMDNSIKVDDEMVGAAYATFRDAGLVVTILPPEEVEQYFKLKYEYDVDETWMNDCEKAGVGEEAKIIKKVWDEMTWGTSQ
jgi:TRAP-type C4-dicarboxylate transport system substrate-binding protein